MTVLKADNGKARMDLVPLEVLEPMAKVREFAFGKYGADGISNWDGVEDERYLAALLRHLVAYQKDNNAVDEESGLPAIYHCLVNAAFLAIKHQRRMKAENNSDKQIDNEVPSNETVFPNKKTKWCYISSDFTTLTRDFRWIEEGFILYNSYISNQMYCTVEIANVHELMNWLYCNIDKGVHIYATEKCNEKNWYGGCYELPDPLTENGKLYAIVYDVSNEYSIDEVQKAFVKKFNIDDWSSCKKLYYSLKKRVDEDV